MPVGAYPGAASSTGNGVTTVFAYNFRILAAADLRVSVDGVVKTLTTDYSVDGVGEASGGNVTFVVAPANGTLVVRERVRAYSRATDYQRNGSFDEQTVDADFDSAEMQIQQLAAAIARAFKGPVEVTADQVLTTAMWALRHSKYIGFDAGGALGVFSSPTPGALVVSAFIETLLDDVDAPTARNTLGMLEATVSPAQIAANQNDYNPAGLATAQVLRINSDARRNVTGLQTGAVNRVLSIHNVGTFPVVFKREDGASAAANRFSFAHTLGGGQSLVIQYDPTSARWRPVYLPEPLGAVKDFAGGVVEDGYLPIDANYSRATYAALFNVVGTAWGVGDGATTFGLFLGAGHALVASGTGTHTDSGGDENVDLINDTLIVPNNDTKWITGKSVVFSLTSGTVTGLTSGNTYYVIRTGNTTIKLASSLANAQNGTVIDLTAKAASVWTITHTLTTRTLGERIGEEAHAMSATELLAHVHNSGVTFQTGNQGGPDWGSTAAGMSTQAISSTGGNAAMNISQPSAVVTRGVRYC